MEINNLDLTAKDLASVMLNIGSFWKNVYEVHSEEIGIIEREGLDLKKRFYRFMNTVRTHYTQGLAALEDIKTELKIVEAEEAFGGIELREMLVSCERLVNICNAGTQANRRLIVGAHRIRDRTKEEKKRVNKTSLTINCLIATLGPIAYFATSAMFDRHKNQILNRESSNIYSGLNSIIPSKGGVILNAAVFLLLFDRCKTGLLDKLIELENKVTELVIGLHKFGDYVKEAIWKLESCVDSITKNLNFSDYSAARVGFQAGKMIERVEDLASEFELIKAMAKNCCYVWCNELAATNPIELLRFHDIN